MWFKLMCWKKWGVWVYLKWLTRCIGKIHSRFKHVPTHLLFIYFPYLQTQFISMKRTWLILMKTHLNIIFIHPMNIFIRSASYLYKIRCLIRGFLPSKDENRFYRCKVEFIDGSKFTTLLSSTRSNENIKWYFRA